MFALKVKSTTSLVSLAVFFLQLDRYWITVTWCGLTKIIIMMIKNKKGEKSEKPLRRIAAQKTGEIWPFFLLLWTFISNLERRSKKVNNIFSSKTSSCFVLCNAAQHVWTFLWEVYVKVEILNIISLDDTKKHARENLQKEN